MADEELPQTLITAVFVTSDIPIVIINQLLTAARRGEQGDIPCIILTKGNTKDASTLSALKVNPQPTKPPLSGSIKSPFIGRTPEDLYPYWKDHLRVDLTKPRHDWSAFTFLVLDAESASSDPPTVLICSDAPDYNETECGRSPEIAQSFEPQLKTVRLPFAEAISHMPALEMLSMTPSETRPGTHTALKLVPPAFTIPEKETQEEDGKVTIEGRWASPEEARARKARGLREAERGNVEDRTK